MNKKGKILVGISAGVVFIAGTVFSYFYFIHKGVDGKTAYKRKKEGGMSGEDQPDIDSSQIIKGTTPSTTSAYKDESFPLAKGMKGSNVKKLQKLLGIYADGKFGNNTEKALIAKGLPIIVTQQQLALLSNKQPARETDSKKEDQDVVPHPIYDSSNMQKWVAVNLIVKADRNIPMYTAYYDKTKNTFVHGNVYGYAGKSAQIGKMYGIQGWAAIIYIPTHQAYVMVDKTKIYPTGSYF